MNDTLMDIFSQPKLDYDYTQILDPADRETVQRCAADIKPRLRRAAEDIVVIGQRLTEVKEHLPHGQWLPWLATEFEMSRHTAENLMRVADRFSAKERIIINLTPTALYLLASPSTPDAAIEEVEQRIAQAAPPTVAETKTIIAQAKGWTPPADWSIMAKRHILNWRYRGADWTLLQDTQIYHANSPCYQEFVRAHLSCPNPQQALKDALAQLRQQSPIVRGNLKDAGARLTTTTNNKAVTWGDEDFEVRPSRPTPLAPRPSPTDNALLSVEESTPSRTDVLVDRAAAENQRTWLLSALETCVRSLNDSRLLIIAKEYAYGIEFARLSNDARFLRDAIASLTPDDRI